MISGKWTVEFHPDFDVEFQALDVDVQDELLATAGAIERLGPAADRPHVGTLSNPKHPNMKELRFDAKGGTEVWRVAVAFDPRRNAILLVAGDKQGTNQTLFYKRLLKIANTRFDQHLAALKAAAKAPRERVATANPPPQRQRKGGRNGKDTERGSR